ncbi:DUF4198 domain-containing protein [Dyadobacter diqingensis]|uniref:DUF4198 domain-containing protein n=1 Tax=Dyadobacter diqingensis TaxID=2938121 RepID=UPI0020C36D40|nr:DUF4198 domain-containing protein [Dyadobacter diqingensis]
MLKKLTLLASAILLSAGNIFAHALWIQTAPVGKAGQKQTVKIIYSEPGETPEKLADWYSDVKEFELWLTGPDKQKVKLTTTAGADHFTSEFTPEKDGVYTLSVGHTSKDLGGTTVYQFNANAVVNVGKPVAGNDAVSSTDLSIFSGQAAKVNKPVSLKGLFKNAPFEKLYITVSSPSGWSKQVVTDEKGNAEFVPIWPGVYFIEASKSWKEEGKLNGNDYKAFWRAATLLVDVVK